jgi:hypothetical protein
MKEWFYSAARPGEGKSRWADDLMARVPGRYVLALDRCNVFAGRRNRLVESAVRHGTTPTITPIYSRRDADEGTGSVRRDIAMAGKDYEHLDHVILLITHEGLKSSDMSGFDGGWTCIIDEVMSIWDEDAICTPLSHVQMEKGYALEPVDGTEWSRVRVRSDGHTLVDLYKDDHLKSLTLFHARAQDRGVFVKLKQWVDAATGDPWVWWSIWNPCELNAFDQIYQLGNAFDKTVTFHLLQYWFGDQIEMKPFQISANPEVWQPRRLTIQYFARAHRARTSFWGQVGEEKDHPDGQECLRRVADWIRENSDPDNHYWCSNNGRLTQYGKVGDIVHDPARGIPGWRISPKIAGSNDYQHITVCSAIYTSKPSNVTKGILSQFGITAEQIIRSRESEDLIQIFLRCSGRVASDTRDLTLRLYDLEQAEFIRDWIREVELPFECELVQIDLGLDVFETVKPGPKPKELSDEEKLGKVMKAQQSSAERSRTYRARKRAEERAAGVVPRKRGRKPKVLA